MPSRKPKTASRSHRDKQLHLRIEPQLYDTATEISRPFGGLSVVVRVLLRKLVKGEIKLSRDEVLDDLLRAPRRDKDVPG